MIPSNKIEQIASEELSITEEIRKEYGELHFYKNELMFGAFATELEKKKKKIKSYPFNRKVKDPYPIKLKPKPIAKDMFISNILTVEAIIKYEMLRYNMRYKKVTQNIYLDILPTMYHKEVMTMLLFSISLLISFQVIFFKPLSSSFC